MKEFAIILLVCLICGAAIYVSGSLPQVAESISDARTAEAQARVSVELARAQQITAMSGLLNTLLLGLIVLILVIGLLCGCYILLRAALLQRDSRIALLELELYRRAALSAPGSYLPQNIHTHAYARTPEPVFCDSERLNIA